MQCPFCATMNPAQARFCLACGRQLVNGTVCVNCHTLLPPQSHYCFHCGAVVVQAVAPGEQVYVPAAVSQPVLPAVSAPSVPVQPAPLLAPADAAQPQRAAIEETAAPVQAQPVPAQLNQLPALLPLADLLPSLKRYLPGALYEPLERRPNERQLAQVGKHLTDLLETTKTYLPHPVVVAPQPGGVPAGGMYRGVFLFGDVSGFTPLSERLKRLGQAGAERIAEIINDLFTDLVKVLFDHGGILLKFGGDAMLGLFPGETDAEMASAALRACQASLGIQAAMGRFSAIDAAGEIRALQIKVGISAGRYFAAHIGTKPNPERGENGTMAYVTTGHTVNRTEVAQGYANAGDVILTQETLDLLGDTVKVERVEEGFHRLLQAPPVAEPIARLALQEPPAGETMAQITYLVNRLNLLAPYLPDELVARIVTNPGNARISPDHRPVTVMFANYVGISDLIDAMGDTRPELITQQLNNYFVHMAEVVERYEGTLARMDQYAVGDRLVIFFGAPRAHEDDEVRAVYTALEMQEAGRKYFSALQTPEGVFRFRQRIGINTGVLFAGNAGAPNLRQEYTLMGDDINLAARLMSKAGWQEIFLSRKTQERVAPFFELKDRGEFKLKGKQVPVQIYEVLRRRTEIGQTRGLSFSESPLIGRDADLEALQKCAHSLMSGRGQIVSVVANSGLGKTRLFRELHTWLVGQEPAQEPATIRWVSANALSFSEQVSYWLAIQALRGMLDLPADASPDDVLFTLWEQGENLLGKEKAREAVPFLANLLNLELEGEWASWVKELDPKVRQKQTFWAAREFFTAAAHQRPTVLFLDDLHFADEASLALVEDLLEVSVNAPLMFMFAFRPRREKGCWRLRDKASSTYPHRYTEIPLKPLSQEQSQELLARLLPGAGFTPTVLADIYDKSAGNPFYLEEVVRSLTDNGSVVADEAQPGCWKFAAPVEQIRVPDSLQGAIIARIDRLTEDARQALQLAAVIGRRFQLDILRGLVEAESELGRWLAQLERSDLVRPDAQLAEEVYIFPDALVQEVAYENLLIQRRQEFHRQVGQALEQSLLKRAAAKAAATPENKDQAGAPSGALSAEDVLNQECELLAYHFRLSDDKERAIRYLEMAGRKAQSEFANETALSHYTNLLELLGAQPEQWQERYDILALRQKVYSLLGDQPARQADLGEMLSLASEHADEARRGTALNGLADLYQWSSKYAEATAAAQQALEIKTALGDQAGQAEALHTLGVLDYYRGSYDTARPLLEQAAGLRQAIKDSEGEAWSLMYVGMIHFMRGNFGEAVKYHENAYEVARLRQDMFQVGIHLTNMARVLLSVGQYEQALEKYKLSLEMKRRVGDRMGQGFNLFGMGLTHIYLGSYAEADASLQASLTLRREIKDERGISYCLHGLGLAALEQKQFDAAEAFFSQALEARTRLGLKTETMEELSFLGQARLGLGKQDEAMQASQQAMQMLAELENATEAPQISLNHARVLAGCHDPSAVDMLKKAYGYVMNQADRIAAPDWRKAFLTNVKVNREILAALEEGRE